MADIDDTYSRWDYYATSNARSEPLPPFRTARPAPAAPPPVQLPPVQTPPAPVQLSPGVWLENDDILHSAEWPPVQRYLAQVRKQKTLLRAPSDLVLALAALSVVQTADDIAHWIFWAQATYWTIGELVDSVALHQPRLIRTPVPWNGAREYKLIVNAHQQKFTCVKIQKKWYTTDGSVADTTTTKRNLRSTTDTTEQTPNEFFGIVDNEGSSHRRAFKAIVKGNGPPPSPVKPPRRPAAPRKARVSTSPVPPVPEATSPTAAAAADETPTSAMPPAHRASARVRRKVSPSDRAPRIVSQVAAPAGPPAAEAATAPIAPAPGPGPAAPTHARNRSSSAQSSASADSSGTVVVRSPSVASVETVVTAPASPGKRKREEGDDGADDGADGKALDADEGAGVVAEGMVTRHRATRIRAGDSAERSEPPSRVGTPAAEPRAKAPRARPRAKRARV
ncbi:hypothetical protein HYPSUDRAFT_61832 [Hypholoma sublateritium FD-334 SS-4]|uniref:Uncharacterized protein n=1 Tax=Hypholoma sublateritium (strain FD-334 SS-4) TaxID=945553 RepID=A0A0D2MY15_HYPSF|nr:hypothetical protein HYPSUDRAFT_61832 [Hypholoma sublateritium FD-334 SS-4]